MPNPQRLPDNFWMDGQPRTLTFGSTFQSDSEDEYMTVTYDFKPPNEETSVTNIKFGSGNNAKNVDIEVKPHNSDEVVSYSGSAQEAVKDCILIIDKVTGSITIEKVKTNVRVKRTRRNGAGHNNRNHTAHPLQDHNVQASNPAPPISDSMPNLDFEEDEAAPVPQPRHQIQTNSQRLSESSSSDSGSSSSDSDSDDDDRPVANGNQDAGLQSSGRDGKHSVLSDLALSSEDE